MTTLKIFNRDARRLWLDVQGLSAPPTGPLDALSIIRKLGYVQLDTIRAVERAHHHIMWSRNQHYRPNVLDRLLAKDRSIFEHYTHDASVIPTEFYPVWQRQFRRKKERMDVSSYWAGMLDDAGRRAIVDRITQEGPLSTHAFDTKITGKKKMWQRPPHKLALDYMWYAGDLATSHRENFKKFYDLSERVIPNDFRQSQLTDTDQVNWLCDAALSRLAFGTCGEIQRFWEATESREVRDWTAQAADLVTVEIEDAAGNWTSAFAPADIEKRLNDAPDSTSRLRILNPFDPLVRDRARLKRLFGFDFRIEIFVPAAKRKWGYYVFPILESDRFVGRIEARANRANGHLEVQNLWAEPRVKWTDARQRKLETELQRFARFADFKTVEWVCSRP